MPPSLLPSLGGKKGAANNAKLSAILKTIAALQALNGRLMSGRLYRSHNTPIDMAKAKT